MNEPQTAQKTQRIQVRVDAYTRVCLTVIAVLLTVLIVGLWADRGPGSPQAQAQVKAQAKAGIPDAGSQRAALTKGLEDSTSKIEELIRLFETGSAKVQVVTAADKGVKEGKENAEEDEKTK